MSSYLPPDTTSHEAHDVHDVVTDLTMKRLMALSLGMALAVDAHLQVEEQEGGNASTRRGTRGATVTRK